MKSKHIAVEMPKEKKAGETLRIAFQRYHRNGEQSRYQEIPMSAVRINLTTEEEVFQVVKLIHAALKRLGE